jgi:hypothetical protein
MALFIFNAGARCFDAVRLLEEVLSWKAERTAL